MSGATPLHALMMSQRGPIPKLVQCIDMLLARGADPMKKDFLDKMPIDYYDPNDMNARILAYKLQPIPILFRCIQEGNLEGVQEILKSKDYQNRSFEELFTGKTTFAFVLDLILEETKTKSTAPQEEENQEATKKNSNQKPVTSWVKIMDLLLNDAMDTANDAYLCDVISGGGGGGNRPPILRVCNALEAAYDDQQERGEQQQQEDEQNLYQLMQQEDGTTDNDLPPHIAALSGVLKILSPFWPSDDPKLVQQFHAACRKNNLDMVIVFLDLLKVNPNTQGAAGMTALHFAARSGCTEVVQYMLADPSYNLNFSICDDRGKTCLEAAQTNQRHEIVALLEDKFVFPGE